MKSVFPNISEEIVNVINKYSSEFKINTPERMCHFLAQIGYESDQFRRKQESGSYPITNKTWSSWINRTWGYIPFSKPTHELVNSPIKGKKKFKWTALNCKDEKGKDIENCVKVPNEYIGGTTEFKAEGKGSKNFLSFIYQCEGGNGDEKTQDGYKYSGKGLIQLTWKDNYAKFNNWLKTINSTYDVIKTPELLNDNIEVAVLASMWYWAINKNLNKLADEGKMKEITYGVSNSTDTYKLRDSIYNSINFDNTF